MSMVRIVTRIIPPNASTESVSELLTADAIDIPVRTQWTTSGDVAAETTFCQVAPIPPTSDPDMVIATRCNTIPGLSQLKKSRLRLVTLENPVSNSQPVIRVAPEVLQDGSCSGILLSIPLRIPRSEIHGTDVNKPPTYNNEPNQNVNGDVPRTHSSNGEFHCSQCNKSFRNLLQLQYHSNTHKGKPQFKCDRCGKKYQGKKKLVLHMKTHNDEDSALVKCPFCDKRLKSGKLLKRHMSVHARELPHQCTVCQERFRTEKTLLDHSRQHKREKRFVCVVCGTGFHQESLLEGHYREVHTEKFTVLTNGKS